MWILTSERLPPNNKAVNITWINRKPVSYYENIKDKPFVATGVYYNGNWYWWSCILQDYLSEYGTFGVDTMDSGIEVVAWQDLPEPYNADDVL